MGFEGPLKKLQNDRGEDIAVIVGGTNFPPEFSTLEENGGLRAAAAPQATFSDAELEQLRRVVSCSGFGCLFGHILSCFFFPGSLSTCRVLPTAPKPQT